MTDDSEIRLRILNDRLAAILAEDRAGVERQPHCIALAGTDVEFAVTATWDNPDRPPLGRPRTFGVELAIRSPTLFDETVYEYSYGGGLDDEDAAASALRRWAEFDLPVLAEAASGEVVQCERMEMTSNSSNRAAPGTWQIYAGPLSYMAGETGAQPCCHACLFTMSMPFLLPLLEKPISCAVKVVASKDEDGATSADCRRNGEDMPDAIRSIAEAARAWPTIEGTQTRRQYFYFKAPAN